jgi:hypothetical protein
MKAKPYKRCGCRDYDGRQLGSKCPRLRGSRHGAWWIRLDAGLADN